jgi:MFS family permease
MSRRQLSALFLCNLVVWTGGSGLSPLLPVYAARMGASAIFTGCYMASAYLTLVLGTLSAGWLSSALRRRKTLLIIAGMAGIPAIWMMGRATSVHGLAALTASVWFLGGMEAALLSTLAGLFAEEAERGKVFGILGMTESLGALLGGVVSGTIADCWGYPTLFVMVALFQSLLPLSALLLEDREVARTRTRQRESGTGMSWLEGNFLLFLLARMVTGVAMFMGNLGRSWAMNALGFAAAAISSTGAVGGAASLLLAPLISWLSDRVGHKRLLVICYAAGAVGLLALRMSTALWHFWLAVAVLSIRARVSGNVGSALVPDLVHPDSLGMGMSLFRAMVWVGGIIGFAGTGYAVEKLGTSSTFVIGAVIALLSAALVVTMREPPRRGPTSPLRGCGCRQVQLGGISRRLLSDQRGRRRNMPL